METVVERPAALDVHKEQVTACVRVPGQGRSREQHMAEFSTTVAGLLTLLDWLAAFGVQQVVMEATGVYWKPIWAILEDEFECLLVNARHVKRDSCPFGGEVGLWEVDRRPQRLAVVASAWHRGPGQPASGPIATWVRAPRFVGLSSGFPVVLACRRLPVLVVERGGCERSSPAGHGWPAEWARKEAFQLCATFDVGRITKNPANSRTIAALDRSSHPQTERRA